MRFTRSALRSAPIAALATLVVAATAPGALAQQATGYGNYPQTEPAYGAYGTSGGQNGSSSGQYGTPVAYGDSGYGGSSTYGANGYGSSAPVNNGGASGTQAPDGRYTPQEIVDAGNTFFGRTSQGLAKLLERAFNQYGLPNGYILGQEASGAFIAGLTYGEGQLYTKNAGSRELFWQGPTVGVDYGGSGSRIMVLVYNLPTVNNVFGRFAGVSGSAYVVAGLGMNVLSHDNVIMVPIRTGVGARLGVNVGYLKLTPSPTWNPF